MSDMLAANPRLSVSTWSLHRALGVTWPDAPGHARQSAPVSTFGEGNVTLLDVPARVAAMGIYTLEICHFHLPERSEAYSNALRAALESAGVELLSLLIDAGDITDPTHHARDLEWAGAWVETAGRLGAQRARVIAGKQAETPETLHRSEQSLRELARRGRDHNVRVTTENWYSLLSRPEAVTRLLDSLEGAVGLNLDFGNWDAPAKYDALPQIAVRAESCHAKCAFAGPGQPDADDFTRCLDITRAANFRGPYTLIYDGPDADEWAGLATESGLVTPYLAAGKAA